MMSEDPKEGENEEGENRGFKVQDRRRFESSGERRSEDDQDDRTEIGTEAQADRMAGEAETESGASEPASIGFSGFVVGLAQQAFMLLGVAPDPTSGVVHKELDQASAMIDIIAMLQDKTAGNLTEDEARLLEEVLYELRMCYVAETSPASTDSGDNS